VGLRALQFVVVMLFALALVPVGAHLLARPNKIDLPQEQYFTTQAVYLGWGLPTSIVLIAAIVASLALTIAVRGQGAVFWLVLAGFVLIAATLVIYFIWTQPANSATDNWMTMPDNWRELRTQWEFGHSVNAVLTFVALGAVTASTLIERRDALP
jgi:hypothetical protein